MEEQDRRIPVAVVVGTRPEAIKLALLAARLGAHERLDVALVATGQHESLLDGVLEEFGVTPAIHLGLFREGQTLAEFTAAAMTATDAALDELRPSMVVVQGDTTTAFIGALAAFYRRIPVAHVEAGLRSGDLQHPFPEEMNRRLLSRLTQLHFAPTEAARASLLGEGVDPGSVEVTGNTVVDALRWALDQPRPPLVDEIVEPGQRLVLVTAHRREAWGEGIEAICDAVRDLALEFPDVRFVFPLHPNPVVREPAGARLGDLANVRLLEPVAYVPFVQLVAGAHLVMTDSGGIQEEAPTLGKPVLVMRRTTERPEGMQSGNAILVGTDRAAIVSAARRLLTDDEAYAACAQTSDVYGDGRATERIVQRIDAVLP